MNRYRAIGCAVSLACVLAAEAFPNIVGYWRFEDGGGQASDETGRYPGELINFNGSQGWSTDVFAPIVPQTGQTNTGSIRMGGGSAFVDLSNGQDMYLGQNFTIEFFMKPDMPIIGSPVFGLSGYSGLGLMLSESLGSLYWNMSFNGEYPYTSAYSVEIGLWQHVALVKVPGLYSIYLDGELAASDSVGPTGDGPYWFPGTDRTGDRTIGGNSGTFRGWLDEFRISDEALTPDRFLCAVPEPSTVTLLIIGCLAMYGCRRWTRQYS